MTSNFLLSCPAPAVITFYFFTPLEIMPYCSAAGLDFRIIPAGFNVLLEFLTGLIFLFGLIIGSFLNCLIWRLPKGEETPQPPFTRGASNPPTPLYKGGIMGGRSYCPKCGKMIEWYDNIPILSFILLKGRCRHCHKPISFQYSLVELFTGLLFLTAWQNELRIMNYELWFFNLNSIIHDSLFMIHILRDWFVIAAMIVIFVIDLRWYLILDAVTLPAAAIVFVLNLALGISWQNMLISGIIGGSFFLIQFVISKGKWIGGGDIRLGLLMGMALGWPKVLVAIFLAYFLGSIVGVSLILGGRKKWKSQVPLGTFLAIATIITLLWGDKILGWYLGGIFNF